MSEGATRIGRKEFLAGLCGLTAGVPLGAVGSNYLRTSPQATARRTDPGDISYAQAGEDVIVNFTLDYLGIKDVKYLDIGAYHPVSINNTYYFYRKGFRGVLVEPNVTMCEELRRVRPEDTTLTAGIGVTAVREADYFLMSQPAWNTFSKEEAEHMTKATGGSIKIERVIKMPLLDVNDVMAKHFTGAPTFLSIDAEGWHLAILKAIDYQRFRPAIICVETLVTGTKNTMPEIPAFMTSQGYVARGGSFVNTIFVDGRLL
jgi:FkbM family methyltransferase